MALAAQQLQALPPEVIAELNRLRAENQRLTADRRWQSQLFGNSSLSAQHKVVLQMVRWEWERLRLNAGQPALAAGEEPEPLPMYIEDIAKACGIARGTCGDAVKALAKAGAVIRREYHERSNGTGLPVTRLALAPTRAALDDPAHLELPERNHGGKRKVCEHCGSDRIIEKRQLICEDCGEILATYTHYVNGPVDDESTGEVEAEEAQPRQQLQEPAPQAQQRPVVTITENIPVGQLDSPGQDNDGSEEPNDSEATESSGYEPW